MVILCKIARPLTHNPIIQRLKYLALAHGVTKHLEQFNCSAIEIFSMLRETSNFETVTETSNSTTVQAYNCCII